MLEKLKFINFKKTLIPIVCVATFAVDQASAVVLIDFGTTRTFRGASVPGLDSNGNTWNSLDSWQYWTDLTDTTGAVTTVDLGFVTGPGTDSYNGPAGATANPATTAHIAATDIDSGALGLLGGAKEAAFDFVTGTNMRFELAGLDPAQQWRLTFFGSAKWTTDATTVYSVFGSNSFTGGALGSVSLNIRDAASPWLHNRNTVATLVVTPNVNGAVFVDVVGSAGGAGYLNAMSVESVPEPSSASLLALAMGGLVALRRVRRG